MKSCTLVVRSAPIPLPGQRGAVEALGVGGAQQLRGLPGAAQRRHSGWSARAMLNDLAPNLAFSFPQASSTLCRRAVPSLARRSPATSIWPPSTSPAALRWWLSGASFARPHRRLLASPSTFDHLWRMVADNLERYRSYPRIIGGKSGYKISLAPLTSTPL